jgi:hypothetical protein
MKRLLGIAVVVALVASTVLAQSSDPLIGTWKIDPAKSKGTKSGTTVIEAAGKGLKFTVDLVSTDGASSHWEFSGNFDGKDNPVTGKSPYGDTAALTRVNARSIKITSKRNGKETAVSTIVVAPDGKTRTSTTKGTDANGQKIDVTSVYEKQ